MTDYEIIIKVDGKELHYSVLNDLTYESIAEDLEEYFNKSSIFSSVCILTPHLILEYLVLTLREQPHHRYDKPQ